VTFGAIIGLTLMALSLVVSYRNPANFSKFPDTLSLAEADWLHVPGKSASAGDPYQGDHEARLVCVPLIWTTASSRWSGYFPFESNLNDRNRRKITVIGGAESASRINKRPKGDPATDGSPGALSSGIW